VVSVLFVTLAGAGAIAMIVTIGSATVLGGKLLGNGIASL